MVVRSEVVKSNMTRGGNVGQETTFNTLNVSYGTTESKVKCPVNDKGSLKMTSSHNCIR